MCRALYGSHSIYPRGTDSHMLTPAASPKSHTRTCCQSAHSYSHLLLVPPTHSHTCCHTYLILHPAARPVPHTHFCCQCQTLLLTSAASTRLSYSLLLPVPDSLTHFCCQYQLSHPHLLPVTIHDYFCCQSWLLHSPLLPVPVLAFSPTDSHCCQSWLLHSLLLPEPALAFTPAASHNSSLSLLSVLTFSLTSAASTSSRIHACCQSWLLLSLLLPVTSLTLTSAARTSFRIHTCCQSQFIAYFCSQSWVLTLTLTLPASAIQLSCSRLLRVLMHLKSPSNSVLFETHINFCDDIFSSDANTCWMIIKRLKQPIPLVRFPYCYSPLIGTPFLPFPSLMQAQST